LEAFAAAALTGFRLTGVFALLAFGDARTTFFAGVRLDFGAVDFLAFGVAESLTARCGLFGEAFLAFFP
jgi:hypothetical protein